MTEITLNGLTKTELMAEGIKVSAAQPEKVWIVQTVFGESWATPFSNVPKHGPDDTKLGGYFRNGKFHPFSEKHIARCQQAGDLVRD